MRSIDEAQVLMAIEEFESDGIPATVESLTSHLHWDELRLHRALERLLREHVIYGIGPFLHLTRDE